MESVPRHPALAPDAQQAGWKLCGDPPSALVVCYVVVDAASAWYADSALERSGIVVVVGAAWVRHVAIVLASVPPFVVGAARHCVDAPEAGLQSVAARPSCGQVASSALCKSTLTSASTMLTTRPPSEKRGDLVPPEVELSGVVALRRKVCTYRSGRRVVYAPTVNSNVATRVCSSQSRICRVHRRCSTMPTARHASEFLARVSKSQFCPTSRITSAEPLRVMTSWRANASHRGRHLAASFTSVSMSSADRVCAPNP